MIKKINLLLKKYPIIIGIIAILLLMGIISGNQLLNEKLQFEPELRTDDIQREASLLGFESPEQVTEYVISALIKGDLDKTLRAFAIDERLLNLSFADIIEIKGKFTVDTTIAPSSYFREYVPLSSSELTEEYVCQIEKYKTALEKLEKVNIKKINFANPEKQMSDEYKLKRLEMDLCWGSNTMTEMVVKLESKRGIYVTAVTLVKYNGFWKVFSMGSPLAKIDEEQPVREITEREYANLVQERKAGIFKKYLNNDEKTEGEVEEDKKSISNKELLPANYFVVNQQGEENIQKTVQKFTLYLQKRDLLRALNYFITLEKGKDLSEKLKNQGENAKQIKRMLYGLMGADYGEKDAELKEIEKTGRQIGELLKIENIQFLELVDLYKIRNTENELVGIYSYEGEKYIVGFTMVLNKNEWYIENLSIKGFEKKPGTVYKIDEESYRKIKKIQSSGIVSEKQVIDIIEVNAP